MRTGAQSDSRDNALGQVVREWANADSYAASHDLGPDADPVEPDDYGYDDESYADDDYDDPYQGDYGNDDEGYEIVPRDTDLDVYQFKAEIMAHVRSIAQLYWSLAQQHHDISGLKVVRHDRKRWRQQLRCYFFI